MSDVSKVLATKLTDSRFPINWKNEDEKGLMWFYDDLHCPNPISPLYFDIGGWWDCDGRWGSDCAYMYQRFGAPIGKGWVAKNIGGYVYSAVIPPEEDDDKIGPMFNYYSKVMPIYADTFLDRWKKQYIGRLKEMQNAIIDFDFNKSLPEIMIHMEDMLDMKSEAFRIHWIINLAQFQASTDFTNAAKKAGADDVLIGKINVSPDDRNWDSLKALWSMKEEVCKNEELKALFLSTTNNAEIMAKVASVPGSEKFLEMMEAYRQEYGFKAMYTHEFIYKTWFEDITPAYEAVRTYVVKDYDYNAEYDLCMKSQKEAIDQLYSMVSDPEQLAELKKYLELCVKMAPITPDHHFYIDQGIYSHMRVAFVEIGKAMVREGILDDAEDIFMLKYQEIRSASCTPEYSVKELVKTRRAEMEAAKKIVPEKWYGSATEWQVYNEPYKSLWGYPQIFEAELEELKAAKAAADNKLKGIPGCPGVVEGVAHLVSDPSELDDVKPGEILVCKMTNPAWVVAFSKIAGLVTDTGGALSHPAVVAREFNVPCVVGTRKATQKIKTGDTVRVNGSTGIVEVL